MRQLSYFTQNGFITIKIFYLLKKVYCVVIKKNNKIYSSSSPNTQQSRNFTIQEITTLLENKHNFLFSENQLIGLNKALTF